jgi:hypothetical protein
LFLPFLQVLSADLGFGPTAFFKYSDREEKKYCRKRNKVNKGIVAEKSVGEIAVSARDGKSGEEITDRFIVDIAVQGAYEKKENDCADSAESGNKLVFRQRRNKDTDGNERAADKENAENATGVKSQIRLTVHCESNIINCGRNHEGAAEHGESGKVLTQNDIRKSNGCRHDQLIRFHFRFFADQFHCEQGDDYNEKEKNNRKITCIVGIFTRLNRIQHEKESADRKKDCTEHISDGRSEVGAHFALENSEHCNNLL